MDSCRGGGVSGTVKLTVLPGFDGLAAAGPEAAVEGDVEGVEGGFPLVGPALAAAAGGVKADDGQVEVLRQATTTPEKAEEVTLTALTA
jgi:hypothetical protein